MFKRTSKENFFNNEIIVKETIGKIVLEAVIFSLLTALLMIVVVKLCPSELIKAVRLIVEMPEYVILPLIPIIFFIFVFIKLSLTMLKEKKK